LAILAFSARGKVEIQWSRRAAKNAKKGKTVKRFFLAIFASWREIGLRCKKVVVIQGSTHFMVGFVVGFVLMKLLLIAFRGNYKVAVYGPLIPFGTGLFFSAPYLFELWEGCELQNHIGQAVNLFGAYGWLHHNPFVATYLASLNVVAVVCGVIYLLIVRHYIHLIRALRVKYAR